MVKKGKRIRNRVFSRKELINKCLGIFSNSPKKTFNYKQLSKILNLKTDAERQLIVRILNELKQTDNLEEVSNGKYRLKSRAGYAVGKIDMAQNGYGFLISDELKEDVMIPRNLLHNALDGDLVKVYVYPASRKKGRQEGEVMQILERARSSFVGTLEVSGQFAFLIIDDRKMPYDLFIPLSKLHGAKNGQKAIAKITDWPPKVKNPFGEIIEVLGNPGENDVEMHAILAEFDLPYHFSEEVLQAADDIEDKITPEDIAKRRDFRNVPTFTIDPHDAKDFDDALSVQLLENGNYEVGVHIADVTHYVRPKSYLEEEAYNRATSVYLVDRVVSMLPERLSNKICSLRPDEEKLCFSAVFEITKDCNIVKEWIGRTVILSDQRFAYEDAQKVIMGEDGEMQKEILVLHELAQKLRNKRFESGAIAFDRVEVKFNIDEKGKPLGVFFKEQKESNQLIEEFMLLANKCVSEFVNYGCKYVQDRKLETNAKIKTFVYRIHDKPNSDKLESLNRFITKFGYSINMGSGVKISKSINVLLDSVEGKPEQNLIETLAVRSMAKARYSTDNIGHYGLAFPFYTHFTSPIRRYPDMMVHRMLAHYLDGGESKNRRKYEEKSKHSSEMEKKAMDAERASIKYKQAEFMQDKLGTEFDAIISGLTERGIYAEIIENKCEGMISVLTLQDDIYEFDEDNYRLNGMKTGKSFQLGDKIKIEVKNVNLARRLIDYVLAE